MFKTSLSTPKTLPQ